MQRRRRQPAAGRACSTRSAAHGTAIKGPITTPIGSGFRSVNVGLRKALDLYAQVRPCKHVPRRPLALRRRRPRHRDRAREHRGPVRGHRVRGGHASAAARLAADDRAPVGRATSAPTPASRSSRSPIAGTRGSSSSRSSTPAANGRRKVTAVHKANIMKHTDGLWLRRRRGRSPRRTRTSSSTTGSSTTCACSSCRSPSSTTCWCCPNLYGDIVSDLGAGLVGGLGVAPGGELRRRRSGVRADARLGAQVRRAEQGQPDRDDALRRDDAAPPRGARRGRPAGGRDRRRHRRGPVGHLRHEADAGRPRRRWARRRSPTRSSSSMGVRA